MATRSFEPVYQRLTAANLAAWAAVPVTIASDVSPVSVVVDPRIRPLRPFSPGRRLVGQAVTARCENGDFGAMLHVLDLARAGDVVMVDAGGCLQHAYAGEILCGYARRRGIAGLVVNGALRDIDAIASWDDFAAYALGNTAKGPLSKERGSVNSDIVLGGASVSPGDVVLGDNDGIVVIPLASATQHLALAQQRVAMESEWIAQLEAGRTLVETFAVPEAI